MIEQHVTSLEISKRLKELGVKQESCHFWYKWKSQDYFISTVSPDKLSSDLGREVEDCYSAFLASELGELLPKRVNGQRLVIHKHGENWVVAYGVVRPFAIPEYADTMADTMGKMLIYLLEQGIIRV